MSDKTMTPSETTLGPGSPEWRPHEVSPRTEADAQIARALQIVVDAEPDEDNEATRRDYTPDELETLFFALGMAMVQLRKLPGGKEARNRFYVNATTSLGLRGRQDILDELEAEKELRRIDRALDELGVPREAPANAPVSAGQPLNPESRVRWLGQARRVEEKLDVEAVAIVKRTFGDDVDLGPGTAGRGFVEMVARELKDTEALCEQLVALAATIRQA